MNNILTFPADYNKTPHRLTPEAVQFKPKTTQPVFISIVGGAVGLYGNGTTSFELMIGERVHGWLSPEEIDTKVNEVLKLITTQY